MKAGHQPPRRTVATRSLCWASSRTLCGTRRRRALAAIGQDQTSAGFCLAEALTYLHASGTEVCLPMNSSEEQKGMTR